MELRDYLRVIRTRKWIIVQAVIIVAIAALVASMLQPKMYEGDAKVLISERNTGAALFGTVLPELSSQPERGLQTQAQLVQLRPIAETTVRTLGLQESPEALLASIKVSAIGQTNIVSIRATDSDPKRAADVANAMAAAYVEWSKQTKRASIKAAADEVEQRLNASKSEILAIGKKIADRPEGDRTDELSAQLQMATGGYTTLASKLEELRVNEQLETGSAAIVSPAVPDPSPVSPKPVRNTALGLVVGLVFGLGMAFLYEYLDNTIKSDVEAEKAFGVPLLGHIPFIKLEKGVEQHLAIVEDPGSAAAESYRVLRNSLDFINFEHRIKTMMVTSAAPSEGKSTVAANLAASLAQAGAKVAMVSCDFRRPTTEGFFGLPNVLGLSDVLLGRNSLKAALQRPGDQQLVVLTSGRMPPNPSELLGSTKMQELVKNLEEWADWVIIDTPPLLAVSDGAAVARWADGVLMVSRAGISTRESAEKGAEMLANVGANVIGVVVTGSEGGSRDGGYYSGAAYYNHYYGYYSHNADQKRSAKADSGARSPVGVKGKPAAEDQGWIPPKSVGRQFAEALGRVMSALLAFVAVVAVAAAVTYFVDAYFQWGLVAQLTALWR